ncbi:MAG: ATP synthase F1 subunit delta [Bacteroidales bacterium]|nr:ATP synthase F1 subunit delta [Bacteroidales bacterium]
MSTGIIASRYATALLKLVDETGGDEAVVRQVHVLQEALDKVPELRRVVDDANVVSSDQKLSLFQTVVSEEEMAPELRKFLELLIRNGRISDCRLIFNSFLSLYYKSRGIVRGRLVFPSASDMASAGAGLEAKVSALIEARTGKKLLLTTLVDESLIGGFVLEVEDQLLDASVSHQLEMIKRQFIERNRRIV